jgi:hypothetical protein
MSAAAVHSDLALVRTQVIKDYMEEAVQLPVPDRQLWFSRKAQQLQVNTSTVRKIIASHLEQEEFQLQIASQSVAKKVAQLQGASITEAIGVLRHGMKANRTIRQMVGRDEDTGKPIIDTFTEPDHAERRQNAKLVLDIFGAFAPTEVHLTVSQELDMLTEAELNRRIEEMAAKERQANSIPAQFHEVHYASLESEPQTTTSTQSHTQNADRPILPPTSRQTSTPRSPGTPSQSQPPAPGTYGEGRDQGPVLLGDGLHMLEGRTGTTGREPLSPVPPTPLPTLPDSLPAELQHTDGRGVQESYDDGHMVGVDGLHPLRSNTSGNKSRFSVPGRGSSTTRRRKLQGVVGELNPPAKGKVAPSKKAGSPSSKPSNVRKRK